MLYYANITDYGPKARNYYEQLAASRMDIKFVAFVEHHRKGQAYYDMARQVSKMGFKGFGTEACKSKKSSEGATGGSYVAARQPLGFSRILGAAAPCEEEALQQGQEMAIRRTTMAGKDWCLGNWSVKGASVALGTVYLDCSVGFRKNAIKIEQISAALSGLRVPWIMIGDWND